MTKRKIKKKAQKIYDRVKVTPGKVTSTYYYAYKYAACSFLKVLEPNSSRSYDVCDGNYEYIKYKIHSKKPYNTVLPCLHVKNTVTPFTVDVSSREYRSKVNCSGIRMPSHKYTYEYGEKIFHEVLGNTYRTPTIPSLDQAHREALEFFASGCQPLEANFAVNITEISDLLSLTKTAASALVKLKRVFSSSGSTMTWKSFVRRLIKGERSFSWDASGVVASAYLAYSFAIAPLISDISKLREVISSVNDRVDWFIKNNNKPVPVRFTKDLSSTVPLGTVKYPTTNGLYNGNIITAYKATYTAFALATYDVSGIKDSRIRNKLLAKSLGFLDPIDFLYEKIPFSFVIDWFINMGDYLSTFDTVTLFPYVLTMVGHSIEIRATHTYCVQYVNTYYEPSINYQGIFAVDNRYYYSRQPGIPVKMTGLTVSPPTLKQLSLALALGRSFFRK